VSIHRLRTDETIADTDQTSSDSDQTLSDTDPTGLSFGLAELLAVDNFDDLLSRADQNLLDGRHRRGSARDWTTPDLGSASAKSALCDPPPLCSCFGFGPVV
jgi:hypothetical protein